MCGARLVPLILDRVARSGHLEVVTALIAGGGNVTAADKQGKTPLHSAALSVRACGSPQPIAAPHARRCSARTAPEAAH